MKVFVNIGSNMGDRHALLAQALTMIDERFSLCTVSDTMESEPWGFSSPHTFLNVCAGFDTELPPLQVLDTLQGIERSISPLSHRNPDGSYADRLIDIDIVYIEGEQIDSPRLKVPHPHLYDRPFFLIPLQQAQERWR